METTDKEVNVPPENGSVNSESSADRTWDAEKYPSWQKSIGKEYWGNEKLSKFQSMKDVMESIVNPQRKAPEKYEGISEELSDVAGLLNKADVGQEDAKAIADAVTKHLPKKYSLDSLKDSYGADWEQAESDFGKAIEKILPEGDYRKAISEMKANPAVFEFVRIVGKNLGGTANLDVAHTGVEHKKGSGDPFTDLVTKYRKF